MLPHPPQLEMVVVDVSQPSVSGGVSLLQSAWFALHVYWQVVPVHVAPAVPAEPGGAHAVPHALQWLVVLSGVSQPSVSGGVVALQSP